MKLSRLLATSLLVISPIVASCGGDSSSTDTTVPVGQLSLKPAAMVIDVRTAEEFASGHVSGATNINFESDTFLNDLAGFDKEAAYSVYCRSGRRSALAKKAMQDAGFMNVTDLGGIETAAKALALPIVQ